MGFFDKAKAAAEQAAAKAKEGVEDVQAKRELGQAYNELGKAAFGLVEAGDVSHPKLAPLVARIKALEGSDGAAAAPESAGPSEPPASPS